jgi:hypothetical protein
MEKGETHLIKRALIYNLLLPVAYGETETVASSKNLRTSGGVLKHCSYREWQHTQKE